MNGLMNGIRVAARQRLSSLRQYSKRPRQRRSEHVPTKPEAFETAAHQGQPQEGTSRLLIPILGYFGVVNVGAFGLFWYDKNQAQTGGWRVPEKTLQLSALLGGWIGGMIAMETFRHKTKKTSFRQPYFMAVALNAGISALLFGGIIGKNQAVMSRLAPFLNQAARQMRR